MHGCLGGRRKRGGRRSLRRGPGQDLERLDGSLWHHCRSLSKFVLDFPSDDRQLESFARHVAISQDKRQIIGTIGLEIYLDHQYSLEYFLNMEEDLSYPYAVRVDFALNDLQLKV